METLYEIFLRHPKICTDTRRVEKNSIFFALKGPNFNANAFAKQAIEQGCALAVIDEERYAASDKYLLVKDVLSTLQDLAKYHREMLKIPVIGITGSNGKTTTKELISAVLSKKYKTFFTKGNLNNHIGVPISVLSITSNAEIAVIEMGANHVGEIAVLSEIARPDYGLITNIGKAHLEGFGSIEGVKKGKGELYDFIRNKKGTIFINQDNPMLLDISGGIKKVTYGKTENCDVIGTLVRFDPFVNISWKEKNGNVSNHISTQIVGGYNFENIMAAVCIGNYFGIDPSQIKKAIEEYSPSNNRSQILKQGSNTIILDCYNANPVSMSEALHNLIQLGAPNKLAILGDMLEMGEYSRKEHEDIVTLAASGNFNLVVLVGEEFSKVELPENFISFHTTEEAKNYFRSHKVENSQVLIKGSRGIKLETLVEAL